MHDSFGMKVAAIDAASVAAYMSRLQRSPSIATPYMGLHPMLVYAAPLALGDLLVYAPATTSTTNEAVAAVSSAKVGSDGAA
jgi:hypothetical protein